jgi:hypothetical protein
MAAIPPTDQDFAQQLPDDALPTSMDAARPTKQPIIARFMGVANEKLALFWKLPRHWLSTLAEYLHRSFTSEVIRIFNQRALARSREM